MTVPDVSNWASDALPLPFSDFYAVGGVVVYQAVVDDSVYVVGVESSSGQEQWRVGAHPLGRLRGVEPTLVFDPAERMVYFTAIDGARDLLVAVDVRTGSEQWSEPIGWVSGRPFACSDAVCVRGEERQFAFSFGTGDLLWSSETETDVVYGASSWGLLVSDGGTIQSGPDTRDIAEIVGYTDFGKDEAWRLEVARIEAQSGVAVNPGGGWQTAFDATSKTGAIFLAADVAEGGGVWSGFDGDTGELLWTRRVPAMCSSGDQLEDLLICDAPSGVGPIDRLSRVSVATGEDVWSAEFPGGQSHGHVWVARAGDLVQVDSPDGDAWQLAYSTGEPVDPVGRLCPWAPGWLPISSPVSEEPVTYASSEQPAFCSLDWDDLPLEEALDLFGADASAALLQVGNGWTVGLGPEGVVEGVYRNPAAPSEQSTLDGP